MPASGDRARTRTLAYAVCLIAAPLAGLAAAAVAPARRHDSEEQLETIADNTGRFGLAVLLTLASLALLVVAVIALASRLDGRREGPVGAAFAFAGIVAASALTGIHWVDYHLAQLTARAVGVDLDERISSGSAYLLLTLVALGVSVGLIVLVAGLYRARELSPLFTGAVCAGAVLVPVGHIALEGGWARALQLVGYALLAVGLGGVGRGLLAEPSAD